MAPVCYKKYKKLQSGYKILIITKQKSVFNLS